MVALGAGAERGVPVVAGAVVTGVALLAALAAASLTDGPNARVLRWAARLLAAGLVACAVALTVDGIFDV
jgi:hypothetical protein